MIVLKFGGTSVEDARAIARLLYIVQDRLNRQPVRRLRESLLESRETALLAAV